MNDFREPSGWVYYGCNDMCYEDSRTREEKLAADRVQRKLIRITRKLSCDDLKKEAENELKKRAAERAFLLDGYSQKKLRSERLIKKAQEMFKRKDKK